MPFFAMFRREILAAARDLGNDERPEVEGSRSYQRSVTPLFRGGKAPQTLVLQCFGAIREGQMVRDRSLLTS